MRIHRLEKYSSIRSPNRGGQGGRGGNSIETLHTVMRIGVLKLEFTSLLHHLLLGHLTFFF